MHDKLMVMGSSKISRALNFAILLKSRNLRKFDVHEIYVFPAPRPQRDNEVSLSMDLTREHQSCHRMLSYVDWRHTCSHPPGTVVMFRLCFYADVDNQIQTTQNLLKNSMESAKNLQGLVHLYFYTNYKHIKHH